MGKINNIILIGMSLCGKTTVGKVLSEKTNFEYIDTDELIELQEKMKIKNIFDTFGEVYFREREREIINFLKNKNNTVISTGGGMPAFYDNMDKLNNIGITIFLEVPLSIIRKRNNNDSSRPVLQNKSQEQIEALYKERIQFYRKSKIYISVQNMNADEIADIIIAGINKIK